MVKDLWGRPSKKDEDTVKKLEEIFMIDWTVSEACSYAWISRVTYYDWIDKDEEFSNRMEAAKDYAFILARKTLMSWVKSGDTKCAVEILKRRDKRYNDKQEIDQTTNLTLSDINISVDE